MTDPHYIHPEDEKVKAGPMPWTVERSVTTPEREAITRLCEAVELLAQGLAGTDAERQRRIAELLEQARQLSKPDTTVVFDPSNPEAAAPGQFEAPEPEDAHKG